MNHIMTRLSHVANSRSYWIILLLASLSMEAVALIYQYGLDYYPCVLCIHIRVLLLGFIVISALAIGLRSKWSSILMHLLTLLVSVGMLERSWGLLGVERGFAVGSCSMDSGLPAWFALDVWFPSVFKVWEPCGYTPELLFGVTMAEALLVVSGMMVAVTIALFGSVLRGDSVASNH